MKHWLSLAVIALLMAGCAAERSESTNWAYNHPPNGGFEKVPYVEQETGPNLVLIEGGTFTMGRVEQDVQYDWNNQPKRVTVSSFYMDETEITNFQWLEYLYWLQRVFGADYPEVHQRALPDTLVWRSKLGYNEPYVEYYLRHPAYRDYPVVGVNWLQAVEYCAWRTDRVNEFILIREGILKHNPNQINEDNFNTDAYLFGQYESGKKIDGLPNLNPNATHRRVQMTDGILLPRFRLPTEAEWEYAAYGLIGNTVGERQMEKRKYPWNGHAVRNPEENYQGAMLANFRRGRGDYMGTAGNLNDNADITAPVRSYWPNDYGLYNMAGNVSEWVMDVYRPLSSEDNDDFNAFRGNKFETWETDEEGYIPEKDSLGRIRRRYVTVAESATRRNYQRANNINSVDGDAESHIDQEHWNDFDSGGADESGYMYDYASTSMLNDNARVYKGGSWKDGAYWMSPGTRRFLDQSQASDCIGFRCAMTRVGSPVGLGGR